MVMWECFQIWNQRYHFSLIDLIEKKYYAWILKYVCIFKKIEMPFGGSSFINARDEDVMQLFLIYQYTLSA